VTASLLSPGRITLAFRAKEQRVKQWTRRCLASSLYAPPHLPLLAVRLVPLRPRRRPLLLALLPALLLLVFLKSNHTIFVRPFQAAASSGVHSGPSPRLACRVPPAGSQRASLRTLHRSRRTRTRRSADCPPYCRGRFRARSPSPLPLPLLNDGRAQALRDGVQRQHEPQHGQAGGTRMRRTACVEPVSYHRQYHLLLR